MRCRRSDEMVIKDSSLSPQELDEAENYWILKAQQSLHEQVHGGVAVTAGKVRKRYWIIGVAKLAKTIKFRCVKCRRMGRQTENQLMADLPAERLAPFTPPFLYTACDYFGPYSVKVGRNKVAKHYGVIFTCLNTRAVHLEVAVDCSSMEFLQVLCRFFAIRGQPLIILSDNGTQFVGAEKELKKMVKGWNSKDFVRNDGCSGNSPHHWCLTRMGAQRQNCKIALKKAIGEQTLTPFELQTCFMEVSNLVNQRPIGRIPNDPDDGSFLCPNDILLGRASSRTPHGPFRQTKNPRHS
ncbi:uncharacterized protein LOC117109095 [Anneissia japonica]|uniref:uncharacterized protein LOC117109095 n=1 Tax=Anneissia japonica TaxID=1529436 RepID=UPI001425A01C|nr:uncharacterized protein LOC117109095 [Anneissia japonica]